MSAKELGQIHNVPDRVNVSVADINTVNRRFDLAGRLSKQLERMVRQGNYFKLVGIDIGCRPNSTDPTAGGSVSGYFRYYAPTKGRCAAFRHAFKAMAEQMKTQGISMRTNQGYDFKVALTDTSTIANVLQNQATLDGTNGLALDAGSTGRSVFEVYNSSVLPTLPTVPPADLFAEGFDTLLQSGAAKTDFVLNEGTPYDGNSDLASLEFERIPFQLAYDRAVGSTTLTFQWRPDPALYIAVMTGNMEMVIEDIDVTGPATALELEISFMISGWKSIMGNPDKKRSKKKRSKGKGRN